MANATNWPKIDRSGLRVAAIFGRFFLGPLYKRLVRTGQLRVEGKENLVDAVRRGRLIITIDHPSLIDSFFPPMVLYPYWYGSSKFFTWSMPDQNFFEKFLKLPFPWIPRVLRCITIDRSAVGKSAAVLHQAAMDRIVDILEHDYTVVWHIEAGRTCTGKSREVIVFEGQVRRIRKNTTSHVAKVAVRVKNCQVLTAYLDIPWANCPLGFWTCVWRLISKHYPPVTLYVRNSPMTFEEPLDSADAQRRIKTGILSS